MGVATSIKLVPKSNPNDDGAWVSIEPTDVGEGKWEEMEKTLAQFVPADQFMCSVRIEKGPTRKS